MRPEDAIEQAYKNGYEDGKRDAVKWIPVTERLPEAGQSVMVCDTREDYVGLWEFWDGNWMDGYHEWDLYEVTHWMPLPEPPKGE